MQDVRTVLSLGVRVVIDLAANEPPVQYPRDIVYCRLPLNDGTENDSAVLRIAVATTSEFIKARIPTLVACSAGMSRSPAIVAAALAVVEYQPPDEVLLRIAGSGPHDVAPTLWGDIQRIIFPKNEELTNRVSSGVLKLLVFRTHQIERVTNFYRVLGAKFVQEQHRDGPVHYSAQLGETVLEIHPAKEAEVVGATIRLGFKVAELREILVDLRSIGAPVDSEPKATEWGTRAVVRDPDGRAVEIYDR